MTMHREHLPATAADGGVAIELPGGAARLPVSPAGCVALAHAVVATVRPDGDAAAAWSRAADDPAVAAWLAATGLGERPSGTAAAGQRALVAALATAVVAATPHQHVGAGGRGWEGSLFRDALAAAVAHHALAERFEERVAEARLEALRELAYGAGHEINNPLANIAARAQALLLEEREPERRRRLATIVDQAFRARDMIGGLMVFARPPRAEPAATNVTALLRPVVEAVAPRAAARAIRLEFTPPPTPLGVHVDSTQVGEAVRMLAVNAVEAVAVGGRVHLEAATGPADRVRIVVGDDGPGMDAETAARACDPFFSGREAGRGIGLGLPKARRLIESSGGSLVVDSRPGRGTCCIVDLPTAPPTA